MPDPDVANPVGALLLLGATVFLLAAMYLVCYTFFMGTGKAGSRGIGGPVWTPRSLKTNA